MKAYVKHELFVESYELSQHIAACGIDVNYEDTTSCTPTLDGEFWIDLGGTQVFNSDCALDVAKIDVYCYTVGTSEAGKTFNS